MLDDGYDFTPCLGRDSIEPQEIEDCAGETVAIVMSGRGIWGGDPSYSLERLVRVVIDNMSEPLHMRLRFSQAVWVKPWNPRPVWIIKNAENS